jgi:SnoaL-like domain
MSLDNVEAVRRWYAAVNAGTEEIPAAIEQLWDADLDYYPVRKWPEARACHGREDLSRFVLRMLEAYARIEFSLHGLNEVGDDRVLVHASLRTEGRGSGVGLAGDVYICHWLRHGRFIRVEDHLTLPGAIRALGLEGETLEAAGL